MNTSYVLITIFASAACVFAMRFIPFAIFKEGKIPAIVRSLGKVLPAAIMATLVIYCIRSTAWTSLPDVIPVAAGIASTAAVHIWKKNTILSVFIGTAVYMILLYTL